MSCIRWRGTVIHLFDGKQCYCNLSDLSLQKLCSSRLIIPLLFFDCSGGATRVYAGVNTTPSNIFENFVIEATFTLHRFHFDPFLLPKTELFSSLFTLLRFQTKTGIYQLVFTLFLKNASVFLFLTTRRSRLLILAFSNCSVFGVHTTELHFCLAPF